jgi:DNA-binding XRE family transcriptional regulator
MRRGGKQMKRLTRLRLARIQAGMSQGEAAKAVGLSQGSLSFFETELRKPKQQYKEALADFYGKAVEELWPAPG